MGSPCPHLAAVLPGLGCHGLCPAFPAVGAQLDAGPRVVPTASAGPPAGEYSAGLVRWPAGQRAGVTIHAPLGAVGIARPIRAARAASTNVHAAPVHADSVHWLALRPDGGQFVGDCSGVVAHLRRALRSAEQVASGEGHGGEA
jgi:hypothetical protein